MPAVSINDITCSVFGDGKNWISQLHDGRTARMHACMHLVSPIVSARLDQCRERVFRTACALVLLVICVT